MKAVNEYIEKLTVEELVKTYEEEYLVFKKTGICPDGVIRNIADLVHKVIGEYHITFAEQLFIRRCAETFYKQNMELIHK